MRRSPASGPSRTFRTPSLQVRVSLVLAAVALLFAVVMVVMQDNQRHQVEIMLNERAQETDRALGRILELRGSPQRLHADDYSRWDEFVRFVHAPDPRWGRRALTSGIQTFGLDAVWVLDDRFAVVYQQAPDGDRALGELPAPRRVLERELTRNPVRHFFTATARGPLEIWTSSIVPTADLGRTTPPHGYYVIGRLLTPQRMEELGSVAGGAVHIVPAPEPGFDAAWGSAETGQIEVRRTLAGLEGRPVAGMRFTTRFLVAQQVNAALFASTLLGLLGSVLGLVLVWWALARWVGRPLAAITRAMQQEDATSLAGLRLRRDELGQVADLIGEFFAQRSRLIEAREAAEAAAVAKSQFLASVSHELRTPMHGILSFSRFGMRDAQTAPRDDLNDNFRQINECGESLLTLLNALLDLSRLEAGRMPFGFSEVHLQDVIDLAMAESWSLCRERQITLHAEAEPGLPAVTADRDRMLQVLRNLIVNAAKFTPAGGAIVVRLASADACQRVMVEDTGIGIPAGEEELIFHKFTQASHTGPQTGGTGLGLAICREIVEAHEGRVWAENRSDGGARVTFEIPTDGPAAAQAPQRGDPAGAPAAMRVPATGAGTAADARARWTKAA